MIRCHDRILSFQLLLAMLSVSRWGYTQTATAITAPTPVLDHHDALLSARAVLLRRARNRRLSPSERIAACREYLFDDDGCEIPGYLDRSEVVRWLEPEEFDGPAASSGCAGASNRAKLALRAEVLGRYRLAQAHRQAATTMHRHFGCEAAGWVSGFAQFADGEVQQSGPTSATDETATNVRGLDAFCEDRQIQIESTMVPTTCQVVQRSWSALILIPERSEAWAGQRSGASWSLAKYAVANVRSIEATVARPNEARTALVHNLSSTACGADAGSSRSWRTELRCFRSAEGAAPSCHLFPTSVNRVSSWSREDGEDLNVTGTNQYRLAWRMAGPTATPLAVVVSGSMGEECQRPDGTQLSGLALAECLLEAAGSVY